MPSPHLKVKAYRPQSRGSVSQESSFPTASAEKAFGHPGVERQMRDDLRSLPLRQPLCGQNTAAHEQTLKSGQD
jgi:hypothetical protein